MSDVDTTTPRTRRRQTLFAKDRVIVDRMLALARARKTADVATALDVKPRTLYRWLQRHPEIYEDFRKQQQTTWF